MERTTKATTEQIDGLKAMFTLANDGTLNTAILAHAKDAGLPYMYREMTSADIDAWRDWINSLV